MSSVDKDSLRKKGIPAGLYDKEYYLYGSGGMEPLVKAVRTGDFRHVDRFEVFKPAIKMLRPKPGQRILDLGCGRGELCFMLAKKGIEVLGIDYSKDSIEICKDLKKLLPKSQQKLVSFKQMDILDRKVGLEKASFDSIFFLGVIEHLTLEQARRALVKINRLLKPGGKVVIHTNNAYFEKFSYRGVAFIYHGWRAFTKFGTESIEKVLEPYEHLHIYYFTRRFLTRLMDEVGFETQASYVRPKNLKEVERLISFEKDFFRRYVPHVIYLFSKTPVVALISPSIWAVGQKRSQY